MTLIHLNCFKTVETCFCFLNNFNFNDFSCRLACVSGEWKIVHL